MAKRNTYFEDEVVKNKFDIKQMSKVMRYVIPYRKVFLWLTILMIASVGVALLPPLLIKYIVDTLSASADFKGLILTLCGLAALGIIDITLTFFHQFIAARTGHTIISNIRRDIFLRLQSLSFEYYDNRPAGKIVIRVTSYINDLAHFFANVLLSFIINILKIIIVTVFMFSLSPELTAVVLAAIIPLAILIFVIKHAVSKLFRVMRAKSSNRSAYLVESIMGLSVIKSFNRSRQNSLIYKNLQNQCVDNWKQSVLVNELNTPVVEFFWNAGVIGIYAVSLSLISGGAMGVGTVIAFFSYMSMFNVPLTSLANILQQFAQASSNLERIFETIETQPLVKNIDNPLILEKVDGNIEFKNVTFYYEKEKIILQDLNLSIKKGQKIALVGPTGAGKTTIINLITRFYNVNGGQILLDGTDISTLDLKFLRQNVGVLMQDSFIFKGSVIENIRYGNMLSTDAECIEAAKAIHANAFIEKMPLGYYTEIAERGDGLSSGEKQLISFARIVLKNPSVIILDEATSAIDSNTEEMVQRALDIILENRTSIIVAHRLSTVKKADNILYIADKGIKEQGTHDELINKKGYYFALASGGKA